MTELISKSSSKIREVLSEDGSPYLSAGRVGMFLCLLFSMVFSFVGLKYAEKANMLNYCSLIALQFLGTGVIFYGSTKTSEAFKAKWTPDPIVDSKITTIVNKVVSVGDAKLQESSTSTATDTPTVETPDLEDVK